MLKLAAAPIADLPSDMHLPKQPSPHDTSINSIQTLLVTLSLYLQY
jgi:hypothetical protein